VFTEPLPELAARYARKTLRLAEALQQLVYMVGGEVGARIARLLGLLVSPAGLLKQFKKVTGHNSAQATPRVLGIDDFAFRKGYRYGTLLIDLEKGRPIDLLPDREAETVQNWLKEHPGIQIISRDRSQGYAGAIRQAAPNALAVADRFHIMKNLMEALEKQVAREYPAIRQILAPRTTVPLPSQGDAPLSRWQERRSQQSRKRRLDQWQKVQELGTQGYNQREIAEQTGICARTIRRYLRAPTFSERSAYPCPPGKLTPFHFYLVRRWEEGCQNALQLWRELKEQGFSGGATIVREYVRFWRVPEMVAPLQESRRSLPSVRAMAWLLLPKKKRTEEQNQLRKTLLDAFPSLAQGQQLVEEFRQILRCGSVGQLSSWLETTARSGLMDFVTFVRGVEADRPAVEAGVRERWSNGPVEGQVNRLKFIKRQGYGRANFALLKARTLPFPA
jgi:transposase